MHRNALLQERIAFLLHHGTYNIPNGAGWTAKRRPPIGSPREGGDDERANPLATVQPTLAADTATEPGSPCRRLPARRPGDTVPPGTTCGRTREWGMHLGGVERMARLARIEPVCDLGAWASLGQRTSPCRSPARSAKASKKSAGASWRGSQAPSTVGSPRSANGGLGTATICSRQGGGARAAQQGVAAPEVIPRVGPGEVQGAEGKDRRDAGV